METTQYIIMFAVGIGAGFINTLAGGGSIITVSTMILFGVPSAVANGTNRIALVFQNISATANFKRKGYFNLKMNMVFAVPAVIGSIIGSNIAVTISDEIFNRLLAVIMIIILVEMLLRPKKKERIFSEEKEINLLLGGIVFFFIGLYGGIIQAGVGFVIIGALGAISQYNLIKINAIKVFVIGAYTISALVVFIINDKVDFKLGIIVAMGNALGAYIGSNLAVSKGEKWIKTILTVTIILLAVKLLTGF